MALAIFAATRPAEAGLAGLWQLNEATGQIIHDSSGNGLDGYLGNSSTTTTYDPAWSANGSTVGAGGGSALYFPAGQFNNRAQVNDTALLTPSSALTLAVDFNADNFNQGVLVSKHAGSLNGSYMLSIPTTNGSFSFTVINASSVRVNLLWPIPLGDVGKYHQLAGTYDGATMRLYYDGILRATGSQSGKIQVYTAAPLMFGDYTSAVAGWEYQGYLDNAALFNTALSDGGVAVGQAAAPGSGIDQLFHQGAVSFVPAMTITNAPVRQVVALGGTATFSVGVSGGTAPLAYQWQFNGTNLVGATANPFTISSAQLTNAGNYTVIVNDANSLSVTSTPAILTVSTGGHLVGLWQLNEGTGQIIHDTSGNGLEGYLGSSPDNTTYDPTWSTSGSTLGAGGGSALYFPAGVANTRAQVDDTPLLTPSSALTLAVDFEPTSFSQGVMVCKHGGGTSGSYMLDLTPANGDYNFMIINSASVRVNLTWPVPPGDLNGYHQLVGTYDSATGLMKLYHDGVLCATASQLGNINLLTSNPLMFGNYNAINTLWEYNGYIDNVALFDVALGDGGAAVGQAAAPGSAIYELFHQGAASLLSGIPTNSPAVVTNPPLTGTMLINGLQLAGDQGVLSISNTTGTRYSVEQAANLPNGWTTIATTQFANAFTSALPASPRAFWRLQQPMSAGVLPFVSNSWTLVVLPDTQYYSCGVDCASEPELFKDQMRWIIANRDRYNIKYVVQLGDIVDSPMDTTQWTNARAALTMLDGVVPYAFVPGNHDYGSTGVASDRTTLLNNYFPVAEYSSWPTFGGTMTANSMEDSYHLFSAGGVDWLILALEWGPRSNAVAWANQIVSAYPNRKVILITHAYTYSDNTRYNWAAKGASQSWNPHSYGTANDPGGTHDGEELWTKLVSLYPNFVMVLNGHVLNSGLGRLESTNNFGNVVHQMLVNYQMQALGGGASLRLVEFLPDGKTEQVTAYSPYYGTWMTDSGNQFVLTNHPPLQ